MSQRQNEIFLYLWSRRRQRGAGTVALRGAIIGAIGGFIFMLVIVPTPTPGGAAGHNLLSQLFSNLGYYAAGLIGGAVVSAVGAHRVFARQEMMFQRLLKSGAQVPAQKPELAVSERGPLIAVIVTLLLIVGFIVTLFVMFYR